MATGDPQDIASRLFKVLPTGWFPSDTRTRISAETYSFAQAFAAAYQQIGCAKQQARVTTATGGFVELISNDFFGLTLPRLSDESDEIYSARIRREVFRDRATRNALDSVIFDLIGVHPSIFEARRIADTGAYGTETFAYGSAGKYGSKTAPFEVFMTMPYPTQSTIAGSIGWGVAGGGYGPSSSFYLVDATSFGTQGPAVSDVLAAIERVRAAGITVYVSFTGTAPT